MAKQTTKTTAKKNTTKKAAPAKSAAKKPASAAAANRTKGVSKLFSRNTPRRNTSGDLTPATLLGWNKILALLYLVQGGLILLLSTTQHIPVFANYLAADPLATGTKLAGVTAVEHLFDVNVAYLVAAICFVFAVAHALAGTVLKKRYQNALSAAGSSWRWGTYAVGFGGVMVLIALLCGVRDIASLILVFGLTLTASVAAGVAERVGTRGAVQTVGFLAYGLAWLALAVYLVNAAIYNGNVSGFVYWLFVSTLVLTFMLALTLRVQQLGRGQWANYLFAERRYLLLSFITVTAVVWQVFVGLLQP
jgi:hypothetical protein